jgi:hypothetical protein
MDNDQKVWRYLSFSRFMWMLQNKQLWLSRADKLDDPWELAIEKLAMWNCADDNLVFQTKS